MRCPKCGTISFDWIRQCEKCGKELSEQASALGFEGVDGQGVNWFDLPESGQAEEMASSGPDISSIDVSDLVAPSMATDEGPDEIPELDPDEVVQIAGDESLSRVLDEAIAEA